MSNKVFYQHPNLMRALGMHETVMEVMVNVLGGGDSKVLYKYFFLFVNCWLNLNMGPVLKTAYIMICMHVVKYLMTKAENETNIIHP